MKSNSLKKEHLICSNLTHLEAVTAKLLKHRNECISVMNNKTLTYEDGSVRKLCIDLVLQGGAVWMKVVARNPKALTIVSSGEGSYGQRSILDQAMEFIDCSKQHLHYFKPPTVIFSFANGIEDCVAEDLKGIGVQLDVDFESDSKPDKLHSDQNPMVKHPIIELEIIRNLKVIKQMTGMKLNLGVTTLIAYVSALTNGGTQYHFETEILRQHAEWERARPVKPILDQLFEGRELYCCKTAVDNFRTILKTLGGEGEKKRGEEFLKKITVVEDKPTDKLKAGGKIKERSLAIFGTGEYLEAVTVTANHAFVRSAINQGVYFTVFLHESRALTEGKQLPLE